MGTQPAIVGWKMMGACLLFFSLIWDSMPDASVREAMRGCAISGLIVWVALGFAGLIVAAVKEVELDQKELEADSRYAKALASMCPGDPADRGWVGSARPSGHGSLVKDGAGDLLSIRSFELTGMP
jgi:hypothetical protein